MQLKIKTGEEGEFYLIGHAHTDLAWLWPVSETIHEVVPLTFRSVLNLMEQYSDFIFAQSSAQAYKWMERYYPELFSQVKEKIAEGRWEVVGGAWVEHTANIPGGESLVRQYFYGKRYFKEKFDKDVKLAWLPDTFGFNWNLPQIYNKCGIEYFYNNKLKWQIECNNPAVPFPYHLFWWQGSDGSRVLAYHDYGEYTDRVIPVNLIKNLKKIKNDSEIDKLLIVFGKGDHGGGPMPDMLRRADYLAKHKSFPKIHFKKASQYFSEIKALPQSKNLPVYNDELYLKTHRGTLSTDSQVKRDNRICETLLLNIEKYSFIAHYLGKPYPQKSIQKLWEKFLYSQVHDNIDGASLHMVYLDAATDYNELKISGNELLDSALEIFAKNINTSGEGEPIIVFNPSPWQRSNIVELRKPDLNKLGLFEIVDNQGKAVPFQVVNDNSSQKIIFHVENIQGMGYKLFRLLPCDKTPEFSTDLKIEGFQLSNSFIKIKIDEQTGNIFSMKKNGTAPDYFNKESQGNDLEIWVDEPADPPNGEPAWNINLVEKEEPPVLTEISIIESGPVRAVVRVKKNYNKSTFEQNIILYAYSDCVDFEIRLDWHEKYRFAKIAFPFQLKSDYAAFEIPFGFIERFDFELEKDPGVKLNNPSRAWEQADRTKFEVAALRWANVTDKSNSYGVTLLNDSKYGFSYEANTLRMSLVRGVRRGYSRMPDTWTDQSEHPIVGIHKIKYALFPHKGNWRETNTVRRGVEFNSPFLTRLEPSHQGGDSNAFMSVNVEPQNIIIEAIKKAENSGDFVFRIYEAHGKETEAVINFSQTPQYVRETDMLEWDKYVDVKSFPNDGKEVKISLKPFEIKTLIVNY